MTAKRLIQLAALGSALLLGGAFVFQALGYPPCKLCLWQRWPHAAAILLGLVGTFVPARWLAGLGGLAAATTSLFGVYHTGVERGWWEGPTSCTGDGGGLSGMSGADLLSTEGASGVIMCDEVAWAFAGLSMASWNAILSALLVMVWVLALRRASR